MVQNAPYVNGPPSHVTITFEYQKPILSGIQVFGIQMVTVPGYPKLDVELREKLLDDDALDRKNCDDLKKRFKI